MAIRIVREVVADVVKRGVTKAVYAKQHDFNSRFLNVRIQDDGRDLTIDSSATVLLNVERPDKKEDVFRGTVNEDGTVKVPLTAWMLDLEGTLLCDISIISADPEEAKLTTMQFNIYVEAAVVSDGVVSDTKEYSLILDLLKRAEDLEANAPGIHVGPEAPERGGKIWIDTDAEGTEINVTAKPGQVIAVEEVDEDGKPTKLKAVDLDKMVEPDFNANEGEPGFIKGRTHYVDKNGVVHKIPNKFIDAAWMATKEEHGGSIELSADFSFTGAYAFLNPHWFPEVGFEWDVVWNGTRYSPAFVTDAGESFLGNRSLLGSKYPDTGEPFLFSGYALANKDPEIVSIKKATSNNETVSVVITTREYTVYNKLPKEFLPDDIPTSGGVEKFVVTITKDEYDLYHSSVTPSAIYNADKAGKIVTCVLVESTTGVMAKTVNKTFQLVRSQKSLTLYSAMFGRMDDDIIETVHIQGADTVSVKEYVLSSGGVSSWNDLTDKPFGSEIVDVVHVPEVTTRCDVTEEHEGYGCVAPGEVIEGGTYKVMFDGATYSGQLKKVDFGEIGTFYAIGNAKVMADIFAQLEMPGIEAEDTGEPFVAMVGYSDYDKTYTWMIATTDSDMHTLNITGPMRVLTKIDNKYISPNVVEEFMDNTAEVGSMCMMNLAGQLDKCDLGETFIGLCLRKFNHFGTPMAEVQIAGYITVPYTGVTPPCGYTKLVANGQGGVKVDVDGREYFVTRFDSVEGVIDIRL